MTRITKDGITTNQLTADQIVVGGQTITGTSNDPSNTSPTTVVTSEALAEGIERTGGTGGNTIVDGGSF